MVVLVVGCDVADCFVESDVVVFTADSSQHGFEQVRLGDVAEVRPFGFDVPEEALDPGLVSRSGWPPVVLEMVASYTRHLKAEEALKWME